MNKLSVAGALAIAAAFLAFNADAQQQNGARGIAKLQETAGTVLVSQGDAMVAGVKDQQLAMGTRVITTAGARATIAFNNGCIVKLGENKRFVVADRDKCAAVAPDLGKAATFAVVGSTSVTNIGPTEVDGDVGVSPGTVVTGFPDGKVNEGRIHAADDLANQAREDVGRAYKELSTQKCSVNLAGQDLGGLTLTPGVYCFPAASAALTGELLLDNGGDPTAVFVFQVDGSLTTAGQSTVRVINGKRQPEPASTTPKKPREKTRSIQDCHIYWQVAGPVTLGPGTEFVGNIFATSGITAAADATVISGRALALGNSIAMNTNAIDTVVCFPPVAAFRGAPVLPAALGGAAVIDYNNKKPVSPN